MTKRSTKSALLLSLLSLVLCVSMLMGTTFAWFTDSVTSANNIIKAGNLDVDVYYGDPTLEKTISGVSTLFNDVKLWEPGAMAWEQLTVVNLGNLALKYTMNVNFTNATKNAEGKTLADILKVAVLDSEPTREKVQAATLIPMKDFDLGKDNVALAPGASQGFYLAIYWEPSAIDNEFNMNNGKGNALTIDLGINLFATQIEAEEDSFGPDYDKDAEYDSNAVVDGNATESTTLETESANVEIPAGAEGGTYVLETTEIKTETDANGVVTATMDITLFRNGAKAEATDPTKPFVVTVNIGAGLNLTKVLHNNVELTGYTYDIATGELTFATTHFSPFTFVYDNGADVTNFAELKAALAAGNLVVNLKNDIEASEVVLIGRSVMINGNDCKIISASNRVFRITTGDVQVIMNDVNIVSNAPMVYPSDVRGVSIDASLTNVELILNDCSVDFTDSSACDWTYAVNVSGEKEETKHTITINGGSYEGANVINARGAKNNITVKNATLNCNYPKNDACYGACIWTMTKGDSTVTAIGNTFNGANAVAFNMGSGNTLVEEDNTDNTGVVAVWEGKPYCTLAEAVEKAEGTIYVKRDFVLDADETITIPAGKNVIIDLNGKTIAGVTDDADKNDDGKITSADNEVMFDVRGTLTVKNGTVTLKHEAEDFGWNACTDIFYVGFNGTLNVENAVLENLGGSDMAFAIDMVNAAATGNGITVNVQNSTVKSTYIPVRVFNNGAGMNNVTIENTVLEGTSRAFWVHVYSDKDNSGKGIKDATLNLSIYDNGNTFKAADMSRIIEFGFDDVINFNADGVQIVRVSNAEEFLDATSKGGQVGIAGKIDVESLGFAIKAESTIVGGTLSRDTASGNPLTVNTTEPVTFKGVTFESVKGSAVLATRKNGANITLDDCTFSNFGSPSTGNVGVQVFAENVTFTFNNCTFNNMPIETNSSYQKGITLVFNNCTFNWVGDNCPGMLKIANYVEADVDFNNCKFNYTTDSKYNSVKSFVSFTAVPGVSTIDFNNIEIVGTRNNDKVWSVCSADKSNVTVTVTGVATHVFNGEAVDFNTYLKR